MIKTISRISKQKLLNQSKVPKHLCYCSILFLLFKQISGIFIFIIFEVYKVLECQVIRFFFFLIVLVVRLQHTLQHNRPHFIQHTSVNMSSAISFKDLKVLNLFQILTVWLMDLFFSLGTCEACAGIPANRASSFDDSLLSSADPSECVI